MPTNESYTMKDITKIDTKSEVTSLANLYVEDNGEFRRISAATARKLLLTNGSVTKEILAAGSISLDKLDDDTREAMEHLGEKVEIRVFETEADVPSDYEGLYIIENEFMTDDPIEIPTTLPNPKPIKFTGAVTGEYDGSEEVEINIPTVSNGGSSEPVETNTDVWNSSNTVAGYYVALDGTVSAGANYCYLEDYISVQEGDVLSITATKYDKTPYFRFVTAYDSGKNVIKSAGMPQVSTETVYTYTVPADVSFVRISTQKSFEGVVVNLKRITYTNTGNSGSNDSGVIGVEGKIYFADNYGVTTSSADNTKALQSLVDTIYKAGGGTVVFGAGNYKFKEVNMQSQVSFRGQGVGATILQRIDGGTLDGFIYFPQYSAGGDVQNLTLVGTDMTKLTDGKMGTEHFPSDYFKKDGMSGIYYAPNSSDGSSYDNGNKDWTVQGLITAPRIFSTGDKLTYKFANIENILVVGFPGFGIYLGVNTYCYMVNNVSLEQNGCGILCKSSDTIISNILVEKSAYSGALIGGGNLKVSNVKSIWNGRWTIKGDRSCPYAAREDFAFSESSKEAWGCQFVAWRSSITNVEVQDNNCHGIYIAGPDVSATGILCDSNGLAMWNAMGGSWYGEIAQDCYGIYLKGTRCYYQIKTCDYKRKQPAKIALGINWCRWSTINWTDQPSDNEGNTADNYTSGSNLTSKLAVMPYEISGTNTGTTLNGKAL